MSMTRRELRALLAQEMRLAAVGELTSATTTTAVDAVSAERQMEPDDYWNGGTLLIVSGTGGAGANLITEGTGVETETNGGVVDQACTTQPKVGADCISLLVSATSGSAAKVSYTVSVTASRQYELAFWTRGDGTVCGRYGLYNVSAASDIVAATPTDVKGATWTRYVRRFTVPAGCSSLRVDLHGSSELDHTVYFDEPILRLLPQSRHISDWVQSTGTWTVPTWTTTPAAASEYHAFYKTFAPTEYDRAINKALLSAFPRIYVLHEDTSLTTATNTYAYALPASIDPKLVVKVEVQLDTAISTAPYIRDTFARIRENNGVNYIQFDALPPSGYAIRITYGAPHDGLLTDWDTLDDRFIPYVLSAGKSELYKTLLAKTTKADRAQVGENIEAFGAQAQMDLRACAMQWPATYVRAHR